MSVHLPKESNGKAPYSPVKSVNLARVIPKLLNTLQFLFESKAISAHENIKKSFEKINGLKQVYPRIFIALKAEKGKN